MALHFELRISGIPIGSFYARRRSGSALPDSLNTYDVEIRAVVWAAPEGLIWAGPVMHRYGDGAWVLIAKALAAAGFDEEQQRAATWYAAETAWLRQQEAKAEGLADLLNGTLADIVRAAGLDVGFDEPCTAFAVFDSWRIQTERVRAHVEDLATRPAASRSPRDVLVTDVQRRIAHEVLELLAEPTDTPAPVGRVRFVPIPKSGEEGEQ